MLIQAGCAPVGDRLTVCVPDARRLYSPHRQVGGRHVLRTAPVQAPHGRPVASLALGNGRFESEAERERVDAAVYGSDTMKNDIGPRVSGVLAPDGHVVTRLVPTPASLTR